MDRGQDLRRHLQRLREHENDAIRDAEILRRAGATDELVAARQRMVAIAGEIARLERELREMQTH